MKLNRTVLLSLTSVATLITVGLATVQSESAKADDLPGSGISVTPAYATLGELFQTEVVNIGMETLGYEVEDGREVEYATIHVAVANGDVEYSPVHWEALHAEFYEQNGGDETMTRLGTFIPDVLQGYLIDKESYDSGITSLDQIAEAVDRFDSDGDGKANLTGCNPGWGCELVIEHHLEAYGLADSVEHDQGKYDALIADTITRHGQGEPIFYYTWTPYWVSGQLVPGQDVEWISVPYTDLPEAQGEVSEAETTALGKNLGFKTDRQRIVANNDFLAENPAAQQFFEQVTIPINDVSAQNLLMQEGQDSPEDIRGHAEDWVAANQELFDSWIEAAKDAGN